MTSRSRSPPSERRSIWDFEEWGIENFGAEATRPGVPANRIVGTEFRIPGGVTPILELASSRSSTPITPRSRRLTARIDVDAMNTEEMRDKNLPFGILHRPRLQ